MIQVTVLNYAFDTPGHHVVGYFGWCFAIKPALNELLQVVLDLRRRIDRDPLGPISIRLASHMDFRYKLNSF